MDARCNPLKATVSCAHQPPPFTMPRTLGVLVWGAACLLCIHTAVAATTYYVSPSGNDTYAGTSPAQAWQTLSRAGLARLGSGDALLLQRNATWLNDPLVLLGPSGATVGAYGDETLPRPRVMLPLGLTRGVECVWLQAADGVTVQDLHVAGCGIGIRVSVAAGKPSGITVQRTAFLDIKTAETVYNPANPAWASAIIVDNDGGGAGTVINVSVSNCIGLRVNSFFNHQVHIDGLTLDALTLSMCGGNCIALTDATDMLLSNTVFLRDTPQRLFLYGTTDVSPGLSKDTCTLAHPHVAAC